MAARSSTSTLQEIVKHSRDPDEDLRWQASTDMARFLNENGGSVRFGGAEADLVAAFLSLVNDEHSGAQAEAISVFPAFCCHLEAYPLFFVLHVLSLRAESGTSDRKEIAAHLLRSTLAALPKTEETARLAVVALAESLVAGLDKAVQSDADSPLWGVLQVLLERYGAAAVAVPAVRLELSAPSGWPLDVHFDSKRAADDATAPLLCRKQHALSLSTYSQSRGKYSSNWSCDVCGSSARVDVERWDCRRCDYDMCKSCARNARPKRQIEPPQPQPLADDHLEQRISALLRQSITARSRQHIFDSVQAFARVASNDGFVELARQLIAASPHELRARVQALEAIARSVPTRFAAFVGDVLDFLLATAAHEDDAELKAKCLNALAAVTVGVPKGVAGRGDALLALALRNLSYDPNSFDADESDSVVKAVDDDDDGWGDSATTSTVNDDGDDDWGDGGISSSSSSSAATINLRSSGILSGMLFNPDDASWEVRQAASSLLTAVASLGGYLVQVLDKLHGVARLAKLFDEINERLLNERFAMFGALVNSVSAAHSAELRAALMPLVPQLTDVYLGRAGERHSPAIRALALSALADLVAVPGVLEPALIDGVAAALRAGLAAPGYAAVVGAALKLHAACLRHGDDVAQQFCTGELLAELHANLAAPAGCPHVSSVLHTVGQMVALLQRAQRQPPAASSSVAVWIQEKLLAQGGSLERNQKREAIECAGALLGFGTSISNYWPLLDCVVVKMLESEMARKPALAVLSQLRTPVSSEIVAASARLLQPCLTMGRSIKLAALQALLNLLTVAAPTFPSEQELVAVFRPAVAALRQLLKAADLQLCDAALAVAARALTLPLDAQLQADLLQALLDLVAALAAQGQTLQALAPAFRALASSGACRFDAVSQQLADVVGAAAMSAYRAPAVCIAAVADGFGQLPSLRQRLDDQLTGASTPPHVRCLALLTLGQLGGQQLSESAARALLAALDDDSIVADAAAVCLGSLAAAAPDVHLATIAALFADADSEQKHARGMEALACFCDGYAGRDTAAVRAPLAALAARLFALAGDRSEGYANALADAVGRLCLLDAALVADAAAQLSSAVAAVRAVACGALRQVISSAGHVQHAPAALWIGALDDEALAVKRAAFACLAQSFHTQPTLSLPFADSLLRSMAPLVKENPAWISVERLGHIQVRKDNGLGLRGLVFDCLGGWLLHFPAASIDFHAGLQLLLAGFADPTSDIRRKAFELFDRLLASGAHAAALLHALPDAVKQLVAVIKAKGLPNSKATVIEDAAIVAERNADLLAAAVRCFVAAARFAPDQPDIKAAVATFDEATKLHVSDLIAGTNARSSAASSSY